ncbi:MAG TPA: hypothetical protein VI911_04165 [Patescibacteria group bacterium]|nr:hypothetical protein [Patescibacteria group bacterium]
MDFSGILGGILGRILPTPTIQPVLLADGHRKAHVAHKDYQIVLEEGPRVPRPAHAFLSVEDLAAWVDREIDLGRWVAQDVSVLVSAASIEATASGYDHLTARAACGLSIHPYWRRWMALAAGQWSTTEALLEALREVEPTFGADLVDVRGEVRPVPVGPAIIHGLRSLSVGDSGEVTVERDAGGMARAIAKGAKTTTSQEIRERWPIEMPVYDCAQDLTVKVEALVSWRYDREASDLVWRVRIPLAEMASRQAREMIVERLRGMLPDAVVVGTGTPAVRADRLD